MSKEPARLQDDPGAPAQVRQELHQASRAWAQWSGGHDVEAGLPRLLDHLGDPRSASPSLATAPRPPIPRAVVLGTGAVAGAVLVALLLPPMRERPPAAGPRNQPASQNRSANDEPASAPPPPREAAARGTPVTRPPAPVASPRRSAVAASHPVGTRSADDWSQEVAQLARARSALAADPAQALALAEEGHQLFHAGILREEREAIAIFALERLGRSQGAAARARAHLLRYPRGPFAERLRPIATTAR